MAHWSEKAVFYHVYPLGYCGAPARNDRVSAPVARLDELRNRLPRIVSLGATALYLGPLFESSAHGYDTIDYRRVDRRLGDEAALRRLCDDARRLGLRIVLDGVFNHVGREHPWFEALRERGSASPHTGKFKGLDFSRPGPFSDGFAYEGWNGCHDLARLELGNAEVRRELIEAALSWIEEYGIDGIRLDAADLVDLDFQRELAAACRSRKPDFWLLGEVVHGDYRRYLAPGLLDSVTNYECWKGLWSSMKDGNCHEIAYSLDRQFAQGGLYEGRRLYSFADNHDVDRVASKLEDSRQLYPLYILLFAMPGIPSIYYGSEHGLRGRKEGGSDAPLRPSIREVEAAAGAAEPDLYRTLRRLSALKRELGALSGSGYRRLAVGPRHIAFERSDPDGRAIVAINASDRPLDMELDLKLESGPGYGRLRDALGAERETFYARGGRLALRVHPHWGRILVEG